MSDEAPPAAADEPMNAGSSSSEQDQPNHSPSPRKARLPRACHNRPAARFRHPPSPVASRRPRRDSQDYQTPSSRIITPLLETPPPPAQLPRWNLRSMWELASLLNFLNVFRPLLNISVEFSAEELETALLTPNSTLDDVHMPLLKAIPPITRMALGRATWVTVLCRKLKDWWHWVADGEIPIVADHGAEVEAYKTLEPATRVLILKALCDIRVEQDDIRSYIDSSVKHGIQLSAFRRERIGGDSHGVSYWYEDDPIIGHRLYREIRHVQEKEGKKAKIKGSLCIPLMSYQWETVATNLDEFQEVSDKLLSSKNRTEVSLAKRLKIDILPEVEKTHKRKERLLKKQHRQALLLDSFLPADGLSTGRALRDRKPVTYTFDDYDRSITEAIKITKKRHASPELVPRKDGFPKPETSTNGKWNGVPQASEEASYLAQSPKSNEYEDTDGENEAEPLQRSSRRRKRQRPKLNEYEDTDGENEAEPLDRSNRQRKRPQRYSEKEFIEAVSDNEADFDSDDDIVGEAVYDDEYLRNRKQVSSSSEGDEEYRWEDNAEEEDEDGEEDSMSISEDSEERPRHKKLRTRSRRGTKLRSVDEIQSGLRRSKRSTRPRINYRQYEVSETDSDSEKKDKSNGTDGISDVNNDVDFSVPSQDSQDEEDGEETIVQKTNQDDTERAEKEPPPSVVKTSSPGQEVEGVRKRRFLDLNELAPGTGFEDGPSNMKDEDEGHL